MVFGVRREVLLHFIIMAFHVYQANACQRLVQIFFSPLWINFYKLIIPFLIILSYNALLRMLDLTQLNQRVYDYV